MYSKLKQVALGLAFSALAIAGGALLGQPAPPHHAHAAAPHAAAHTDALAAVQQAPAESGDTETSPAGSQSAPDRRWEAQSLRAGFQMPYFSFGAILPRTSASLEQ